MAVAPVDETLTLADLTRDPYPIYKRMRAETPLAWHPDSQVQRRLREQGTNGMIITPETRFRLQSSPCESLSRRAARRHVPFARPA